MIMAPDRLLEALRLSFLNHGAPNSAERFRNLLDCSIWGQEAPPVRSIASLDIRKLIWYVARGVVMI
jgi:hypothetical protein